MKHSCLRFSLIGLVLIVAMTVLQASGRRVDDKSTSSNSPIVVVELFTSEGCSSCPPADALLARLAEGNAASNAHVIALEEHVDYWDELGWKDPFSSHDWTVRQYNYAGVLGNGNPYTPQMVVDGTVEFSGSRAQQAQRSVAEAASQAKTEVMVSPGTASKPGTEGFSVKVGKLSPSAKGGGAEVWLA